MIGGRHRLRRPPRVVRGLVVGLVLVSAGGAVASTGGAAASETTAASAAAEVAPLSRLRPVTPAGQQYGQLQDTATGRRFLPRGANFVRLTDDPVLGYAYHSTFEPGRYTSGEADWLLRALRRDGYNTVRVFIDPGSITDADTHHRPHGMGRGMSHDEPFYGPYLDNVADFVRRATAQQIRVMFSLDHFPYNAYYLRIVGHVDRGAVNIDGRNLEYLHESYVRAKQTYLANFVRGLRSRVGPKLLSTVLAYQTDNEAYVVADKAPYHRMSGQVTTLDGLTYDMSDPTQRQQSADANFVVYANRMVDTVRREDPAALVTMGMFTFGAVHRPGPQGMPVYCSSNCQGEYRYPARPRSLSIWSRLSFLDIHIYPAHKPGINDPYTLERNLQTIEWQHVRGVVVVGEFGAAKAFYHNDIIAAAYGMRDMQVATCRQGMSGWLFWTYNTGDTEVQRRFYSFADHRGAINGQLAPIVRPDPCAVRG